MQFQSARSDRRRAARSARRSRSFEASCTRFTCNVASFARMGEVPADQEPNRGDKPDDGDDDGFAWLAGNLARFG